MTDNHAHSEQRPESPEVAARTVLFTALCLVAFVGLSILGARIYYEWEIREPVNVAPKTFGTPRLQTDDAADLARFQKEQQSQLNGYAWIDHSQGIIQIPIERAIALVTAKGAEAYGPTEPPSAAVKGGAMLKP